MKTTAKPWDGCEPTEKGQRAIERIKETFSVEDLPEGLVDLAGSETGLNDLYMNLKRQLDSGQLSAEDKVLIAVSVASAAGSAAGTRFFGAVAREKGLSGQQVLDAIAMGAVCTIFNGYYKFRDLAEEGEFDQFKAPFNANTFMKSSLSGIQGELINVAVSSLNGCTMCVKGHNAKARQLGATNEQIDETVKAGAVALAFANAAAALAE